LVFSNGARSYLIITRLPIRLRREKLDSEISTRSSVQLIQQLRTTLDSGCRDAREVPLGGMSRVVVARLDAVTLQRWSS